MNTQRGMSLGVSGLMTATIAERSAASAALSGDGDDENWTAEDQAELEALQQKKAKNANFSVLVMIMSTT